LVDNNFDPLATPLDLCRSFLNGYRELPSTRDRKLKKENKSRTRDILRLVVPIALHFEGGDESQ